MGRAALDPRAWFMPGSGEKLRERRSGVGLQLDRLPATGANQPGAAAQPLNWPLHLIAAGGTDDLDLGILQRIVRHRNVSRRSLVMRGHDPRIHQEK
jgi:hypothetical protein